MFILEKLHKRKCEISGIFSGSSAIFLSVKIGNYQYHFVDSYWLLRDKLENIGKSMGQVKGLSEQTKEEKIDLSNAYAEFKKSAT